MDNSSKLHWFTYATSPQNTQPAIHSTNWEITAEKKYWIFFNLYRYEETLNGLDGAIAFWSVMIQNGQNQISTIIY